jgi:hypothetical protein
MSSSTGMSPVEHAGVIRLVNCYIAAHIQGKQVEFISKHPETDIKIAQATAQAFAATKNISYLGASRDIDQPIITVIKSGEEWFPAELHPDKVRVLEWLSNLYLGGSLQQASSFAAAIARCIDVNFAPSIGISMYPESS